MSRSYELLLVDDASPDQAHNAIRKLADEDPRVCGIVLAENVGQNSAVLAGPPEPRGAPVAGMDGRPPGPPAAPPPLLATPRRPRAHPGFPARRGRHGT